MKYRGGIEVETLVRQVEHLLVDPSSRGSSKVIANCFGADEGVQDE